MARLFLVRGGGSSIPFDVKEGVTSIGRDPKNDIVLSDPTVSDFHAQIHLHKGAYILLDRNSSGETLVNGKPIKTTQLKGGETICFGAVHCRFQDKAPQPGPAILKPEHPLGVVAPESGARGSARLPEIVKPLSAFYPDPALRHRVHYDFAHHFLPGYVGQSPCAFFRAVFEVRPPGVGVNRFIQSRWMMFEEMAGLIPPRPIGQMIFRRLVDLEISAETTPHGPVALIKMPVPEQPGEAFFVGVALLNASAHPDTWSDHMKARTFLLERSFDGPDKGVLCERTTDSHVNHGMFLPVEKTACLTAIGRLMTPA